MSKKNWFLGLALIVFFSSCNRHYSRFAGSFNRQKEAGQNFVVTRDGNKINSDEVKERSPLFSKSILKLDDGTKIPVKEVVAYQNGEGYFARLNNTGGLLKRVHKGSLDIYQKISVTYNAPTYSTNSIGMGRWSGGGSTTKVAYYLKKGVNGEAVLMHGSNGRKIFDLVSDHTPSAELMERFNKKRKQLTTISYINWAGAAGGLVMIFAARGPGSGTATAGGGLLFGSMISGLVNMIRKGNNYNRMFEAIAEYNIKR
jgi:hypothetical protein